MTRSGADPNYCEMEEIEMSKKLSVPLLVLPLFITLLPLAALGQPHYKQTNLVSDVEGLAANTDPNLVNPWGLTRSATSPWWVSDNGTGKSTLYNGAGLPRSLVVTVPPASGSTPTGTVSNGGPGFVVTQGLLSGPARFLFATEGGTISGWNPAVDPTNAVIAVDKAGSAIYKGMTLATVNNNTFLYVANFKSGQVEVYSSTWAETSAPGGFADPLLPPGYAPFNVENIGGKIFVMFAKQGELPEEEEGRGLGYVDEFDGAGNLLLRLQHGPWLNAPWGVARSPAGFGQFSDNILVGNFGSGEIAAFDPATGEFRGRLLGPRGTLVIPGLWAIAFGGGTANNGATTDLFFTAGIDDEEHGLFGILTAVARDDDDD
jgi:uncharacterized protein (TIGR03118 family)